jgi:hypothetical protein
LQNTLLACCPANGVFCLAVLLLPARAGVQPVLPPRFCDDRVQVLQADARLLTPAVLEQYTTDVSAASASPAGWIGMVAGLSAAAAAATAAALAAGVSTHAASTAGSVLLLLGSAQE